MQHHHLQSSTVGYKMPVLDPSTRIAPPPIEPPNIAITTAATRNTQAPAGGYYRSSSHPANTTMNTPNNTNAGLPNTITPSLMTPINMSDIVIPKSLPSAPPAAQFADYVLYVDGQIFNSDPICQQIYRRIKENWMNDLVHIQDVRQLPERKGWMKTLPVLVSRESKIAFVREHALNELDRYIQESQQSNSTVLLMPPGQEQELPVTPLSETPDEWAQALGNTNSRLHGQEYIVVTTSGPHTVIDNTNTPNNIANNNIQHQQQQTPVVVDPRVAQQHHSTNTHMQYYHHNPSHGHHYSDMQSPIQNDTTRTQQQQYHHHQQQQHSIHNHAHGHGSSSMPDPTVNSYSSSSTDMAYPNPAYGPTLLPQQPHPRNMYDYTNRNKFKQQGQPY